MRSSRLILLSDVDTAPRCIPLTGRAPLDTDRVQREAGARLGLSGRA
jgi:hypothetical protein